MRFWKNCVLFYLGGGAYMLMEVGFRGWSHGSMFLAGGSCFLLLGSLEKASPRLPLGARMILGSVIITSVELLTGLLVNRQYQVWDYRGQPWNFHGQICLPFSALWVPVSLGAFALFQGLDSRLNKILKEF